MGECVFVYTCWAETDMKGAYAQPANSMGELRETPFFPNTASPFPASCVTLVSVDEKLPAVAPREISDSRMKVANVINGTVN